MTPQADRSRRASQRNTAGRGIPANRSPGRSWSTPPLAAKAPPGKLRADSDWARFDDPFHDSQTQPARFIARQREVAKATCRLLHELAQELASTVQPMGVERARSTDWGEEKGNLAPITYREEEVATLIAGGFSNRKIAAALTITEGTAESHVHHILDKLGFHSRVQIAVWFVEHKNGGAP